MNRGASLLVGLAACLLAMAAGPAVAAGHAAVGATGAGSGSGLDPAPTPAGRLAARVAVVLADLTVKPVPKQKFAIVPEGSAASGAAAGVAIGAPLVIATGFDGTIAQALPAGRYRIRSEAPVDVEGKRLSWDVAFEVKAGATTTIELSNDNATIEASATSGTPAAGAGPERGLDAGALYERFRGGVFKIISDSGHGSGFLVDAGGLILTNHHVIDGASYLAAKIDDQHKHLVTVIADDADHDVAVLRIHPDAVRGRPVLTLADDRKEKPTIAVGDRVVAIGSPLTTETILTEGVVSKIQDDRIYSDVNINPGNSGGPLLDRKGEVVGISTFSLGAGEGPGLSGINRIHLAGGVLATARARLGGSEPPSPRLLPVESTFRFDPAEIKKAALATERKTEDYILPAEKFDVMVLTPVLIASRLLRPDLEATKGHDKRRKETEPPGTSDSGADRFYAWQKDDDNFRAVVAVRAFPGVKMTAGSAWKLGFTGRGGKYQFKADFDRMELRRGTEVIEPILPGRVKESVSVAGRAASLHDILYWGYYEYPPEAFRSGADVTLRLWEQGVAEPQIIPLSDSLLEKIREDYRAYLSPVAAPKE